MSSDVQLSPMIALSFTQRQQLLFADMVHPNRLDPDGDVIMDTEVVDDDGDEDWVDQGLACYPPGEEGFFQSHAGSEAILHDILNNMTSNKCIDPRTCKDQIQHQIDGWRQQTPSLATCYLDLKQLGCIPEPSATSTATWEIAAIEAR
ncbi:hypothetical protein BJ165DRAFT_1533242 [Panaeolus papilionaceus]|nr:hypothetical protein BJ165DRAFT_1533242 [Panaeolus papilionaceus]